ncbi:MAG: hypothetical protein DMF52_09815, partial [Acidobacteria bacterium]
MLLCLLGGGAAPVGREALAVSGDGPLRVAAVRADSAVEVDGRLDEAAWERAGVIPDLTQHAPRPG